MYIVFFLYLIIDFLRRYIFLRVNGLGTLFDPLSHHPLFYWGGEPGLKELFFVR